VVNLVTGPGPGCGEELARSQKVDKVAFTAFTEVTPTVNSQTGLITFKHVAAVRRSFLIGAGLVGNTSTSSDREMGLATYMFLGRANNNGLNFVDIGLFRIVLPLANSTSNPAYTADSSPIFTGLPYSFYVPSKSLPSDFGIYGHFGANTMTRGDRIIVSTGTEEWEILEVSNTSNSPTGVSPCFLARVV
jgi:hypothetical protein